jgi:hypothetical protein
MVCAIILVLGFHLRTHGALWLPVICFYQVQFKYWTVIFTYIISSCDFGKQEMYATLYLVYLMKTHHLISNYNDGEVGLALKGWIMSMHDTTAYVRVYRVEQTSVRWQDKCRGVWAAILTAHAHTAVKVALVKLYLPSRSMHFLLPLSELHVQHNS